MSTAEPSTEADRVYQLCEHGRRYCKSCGTVIDPGPNPSGEQWSAAYRILERSRQKKPKPD